MASLLQQFRRLFSCFVLSAWLISPAVAAITWNVAFDDSSATFTDYYDDITSHTVAAGNDWASYMDSSLTASLEVIIHFDPNIPTANGGSVTSDFVENNGTHDVFQQGAAAEILSGIDPNGSEPDITITIGVDYLATDLWFYSDPSNRIEEVPGGKTEAYKTLAHELGHALAFNGWRDSFTGSQPSFASPFDVLTTFDGEDFFFTGSAATSIYGSPVPLTYGNHKHVGNNSPRPGDDLLDDLMNGVVTYQGTKYNISPLDLAIAQDVGLPIINIPGLLTGDFDNDLDVDGNDFLAWQRGESPSLLSQGDLDDWLSSYGTPASLLANTRQVPEPPTGLSLLLGTIFVLIHTRTSH